jgi:hypothetical protein
VRNGSYIVEPSIERVHARSFKCVEAQQPARTHAVRKIAGTGRGSAIEQTGEKKRTVDAAT